MNTVNLDEQITEYQKIQRQIKELEERLKPVRAILEESALNAGGVVTTETHVVKLVEISRENLNLKEAKKELGDKLNPFISTTHYTQLRVS